MLIADPSARRGRLASVPNDPQPLDDVDRALLAALSENARLSNAKLAERAGIAPSTAVARLRNLRRRGVLRGFHAEVDLAALGRPLQALVAVRLAVHAREQIATFTTTVRQLPGRAQRLPPHRRDRLPRLGRRRRRAGPARVRRRPPRDEPRRRARETSLIYEHARGAGVLGALDAA